MWEYRAEFENCLRRVIPSGDVSGCFDRFFEVSMGAVDFTLGDVEDVVEWVCNKTKDFNHSLNDFLVRFPCDVVTSGEILADPYWDSGLISGINLRVGDAVLYACPLVPMATSCWMALVQTLVAANVLAVDGDCVLMLPVGQYLDEEYVEALKKLYKPPVDISNEFQNVHHAYHRNGHIIIDTTHKMKPETLNAALKKYNVNAIVKVNLTEQTAILYTGKEPKLPKLQAKIYYDWHQNWSIY